ncbi:MAG: DnaD domain-containing protein [Limnochordia bacterium]
MCRAYEEHIGILGPLQVDKLRLWLEDPELAKPVEVVAKAIELASESGNRRINYVEGILRNWHNDGVRTLTDIEHADHRVRGDSSGREEPGSTQKPIVKCLRRLV